MATLTQVRFRKIKRGPANSPGPRSAFDKNYQSSFRPNCNKRGWKVPADWPKFVSVIRFAKLAPVALLGSLKLARLKALKISNRNWKLNRSDALMFLNSDSSDVHCPGPRNVLRPRLPSHALHGVWKKEVAALQVPGPVLHHALTPVPANHPFAH